MMSEAYLKTVFGCCCLMMITRPHALWRVPAFIFCTMRLTDRLINGAEWSWINLWSTIKFWQKFFDISQWLQAELSCQVFHIKTHPRRLRNANRFVFLRYEIINELKLPQHLLWEVYLFAWSKLKRMAKAIKTSFHAEFLVSGKNWFKYGCRPFIHMR